MFRVPDPMERECVDSGDKDHAERDEVASEVGVIVAV